MKICPNPDCGHRKLTGNPAEYNPEVERCADCGCDLILGDQYTAAHGEEQTTKHFPGALLIKAGLTLGLLCLLDLLESLSLPGIDLETARGLIGMSSSMVLAVGNLSQLSIVALGIVPFVAASQLVEFTALIIPGLRPLRIGGPVPRARLQMATFSLTVVVAAIQAYFLCSWIVSSSGSYLSIGVLVPDPGTWFFVTGIVTLVAAVFLYIGIAHAISRHGVGNGFSLLIGWGMLTSLISAFPGMVQQLRLEVISSSDVLLFVGGAVLLIYATVRLTRSTSPRTAEDNPVGFGVHLPTCGLIPISAASSVLMLPAQFASTDPRLAGLSNSLVPGGYPFLIASLVLIGGLGYLFSMLFYRPAVISRFIKEGEAGAASTGTVSEAHVRKIVSGGMARSLLFLGALAVFLHFIASKGVGLGGTTLVVLTMIALDLWGEWKTRRQDPRLTKVWELHRLYAVDRARGLLAERGIPSCLRGMHHRSLLYFFGPYLPIDVMVPSEKASEAHDCLQGAFTGK